MILERLARAGLERAARRWPDDLSGILRDEWAAELAALRGQPWKMLTFAGSLVISPAVDEPSWGERAIGAGRAASTAAGVTLFGAALFNGAHVSGNPALLVAAAAVLAAIGTRVRLPGGERIGPVLIGLALFAFLWTGNEVAVMPFMGVLDVAPAVATWTLGTALALRSSRGRFRAVRAVAGTLATLELATIAGSWHGAGVLGSPPVWFPLGGEGLLAANASAMAGPMLLCSVFVLTSALRRPIPATTKPPARIGAGDGAAQIGASIRAAQIGADVGAAQIGASDGAAQIGADVGAARIGAGDGAAQIGADVGAAQIGAGVGAALAGLAFCEWMGRSTPMPHHLLDNSFTFGFGFAAHPAGRAAVALLIALLIIQVSGKVADPM